MCGRGEIARARFRFWDGEIPGTGKMNQRSLGGARVSHSEAAEKRTS